MASDQRQMSETPGVEAAQSRPDQDRVGAQRLSKIALLAASAAYFSGLLITNISLGTHGFFLFHLIKADYMLTGALWLALLALAYVWTGAVWNVISSMSVRTIPRTLVTVCLLGMGYALIMTFLTLFTVDAVSGLSEAGLFYASCLFIGQAITIHIILFIYRRWNDGRAQRRGDRFLLAAMASLVAALIFMSAYYRYAMDIYPQYPRIIGGGRPAMARLVIRADSLSAARLGGLDVDASGRTEPVSVLYETDEAYFVVTRRAEGPRAVKVAASDVVVVSYLPTGVGGR